MRLPKDLGQEVVESIIGLFSENTFTNAAGQLDLSIVSDQTWHGSCLALAELARRGLLLPEKLPSVLKWIFFVIEHYSIDL